MKTARLDPKMSNGNPNVITITNKEKLVPAETVGNALIDKEHPEKGFKLGEYLFTIPAEKFEFKEFENVQEALADAGSEVQLVSFINDALALRATAKAKNYIRNAETSSVGIAGDFADVVEAGLKISRDYTINEPTELSTKQKAAAYDDLIAQAKAGTASPEQLAEMLRKMSA